jgi:hypothetical protein
MHALAQPQVSDSELKKLWWMCQKYKFASQAVGRQYRQAYSQGQDALAQALQTKRHELLYHANLITLSVLDTILPQDYRLPVEEYCRAKEMDEEISPHTLAAICPTPHKIYWEMGNLHKPHYTPEDCEKQKMSVCKWIYRDNLMSNQSLLAFETLDPITGEMRYFNIPLTLVNKETALYCLLHAEPKPSIKHQRHLFPRVLPDIDEVFEFTLDCVRSGERHLKKALDIQDNSNLD